MIKKLIRDPKVSKFLSWLIAKYMGFVFKTSRIHVEGEAFPQRYWEKNQSFIGCFWHGRMLMMYYAWKGEMPFNMLISSHPDGQIIANAIKHLGVTTILGSKSKGGTQALRKILRVLKRGEAIGITPDGPRGPCYVVSEGIANISKLSGLDIVPASYGATKQIRLKSWDKFMVALPFGHIHFVYAEPIPSPGRNATEKEVEAIRQQVEKSLKDCTQKADQHAGVASC